jgi:hypothetical protein
MKSLRSSQCSVQVDDEAPRELTELPSGDERSMSDVGNVSESIVRVTTTISIIALPLILACSDEIGYRSLRITIMPPGRERVPLPLKDVRKNLTISMRTIKREAQPIFG